MSEDWSLEIVRTLDKMLDFMKRITLALEQIARKGEKPTIRISSPGFTNEWEKETPIGQTIYPEPVGRDQMPSAATSTTMVETQNFVDVRECKYYSEKSYKLIGYDNREVYIAMSHVIKLESIEGGGTRVIVKPESAWVIEKLEWK